ncbi:hypothetical protein [Shinella zoogloeoides]
MTGSEIMAVVGFFLTVFGSAFVVWKYLDGKLTTARKETGAVERDLAAHRIHVAETYVTKAGMSEQTAQIMKALDSVGAKIDRTNERLDSLMQPRPAGRTARAG